MFEVSVYFLYNWEGHSIKHSRYRDMWRLVYLYFFLISPSFGASGALFFVIVAFSGYIDLYFYIIFLPKYMFTVESNMDEFDKFLQ